MIDPETIRVECVEDKPKSGMWHCGPNPCWITITHIPSQSMVRVFSGMKAQHATRRIAMDLLEIMLEETAAERCSFPERITESGLAG